MCVLKTIFSKWIYSYTSIDKHTQMMTEREDGEREGEIELETTHIHFMLFTFTIHRIKLVFVVVAVVVVAVAAFTFHLAVAMQFNVKCAARTADSMTCSYFYNFSSI